MTRVVLVPSGAFHSLRHRVPPTGERAAHPSGFEKSLETQQPAEQPLATSATSCYFRLCANLLDLVCTCQGPDVLVLLEHPSVRD